MYPYHELIQDLCVRCMQGLHRNCKSKRYDLVGVKSDQISETKSEERKPIPAAMSNTRDAMLVVYIGHCVANNIGRAEVGRQCMDAYDRFCSSLAKSDISDR